MQILNQLNTIPGTDPIDKLRQTAKTDANGKAEFEYTYESILNIEVDYTNGNDSYTGSGVIRLLRGKIISETVEIN